METQHQKVGSRVISLAEAEPSTSSANTSAPVDCSLGDPTPHHHLNWHWLRSVSVGLVILLISGALWIGCGFYLSKVQLGANLVSLHVSDTSLQNTLSHSSQTYNLTLAYPNGKSSSYNLSKMGLTINAAASIKAIRKQQHQLIRLLAWWRPINLALPLNINSAALSTFIVASATVIVQPAKDAALTVGSDGSVQLATEAVGKEYGLSNASGVLQSTASWLTTRPLQLQTLSLRPAITSAALSNSKSQLEQIINQPISFNVGGTVVHPKTSDVASWIELSSSDSAKTVSIVVDSGKVSNYINSIAAADSRLPRAQVIINQADGSSSVLVPGIDGVQIQNQQSVATNVTNDLLVAKGTSATLTTTVAPYQTITAQSYPKWIEVDTTNKRMYAYEQGTLIKTFLVSAGAPATPTVTGQYAIYAKYVSQNMSGLNVDGTSYRQPNVPWINYFYKDYAIHGNYWRPLSYFGRINSSHGCVGIVPSDGQWIYDWAPINTPVIVHT